MELTIFTPTYNRVDLIERLYDSLVKQTSYCFCWLIVDDGSSDGTAGLIAELMTRAPFTIRYLYQENEGKTAAFNAGVASTETPFFLEVDSDDWLQPDAVDQILQTIAEHDDSQSVSGYVFQCVDSRNKVITSKAFPQEPWYAGFYQMIHEAKITGDTAIVFDVSKLKLSPFERFGTEKFVPEALVLHRMEQRDPFVFYNRVVKVVEYQVEGLSASMAQIFRENPQGYYRYCCEFLVFYHPPLMQRLRHLAAVGVFGRHINKKFREMARDVGSPLNRMLLTLLYPITSFYRL